MLKTVLSIITVLAVLAIVILFGPTLLGRSLRVWELLVFGVGCMIVVWTILVLRKRQSRRHLGSLRDSALW
ncbi:MAG TPA: hypothetical protein DCP03_22325 [Polaromonas sp.]|nr:hypothetical protein [Polaromonas sp.]